MNEMQTSNDLQGLATQINEAHRRADDAATTAVEHALIAGRLLIEAKAQIPHGGWLPWLKENCEVSERTAQAYMRLALRLPELDPRNPQRVADLPLREALCLLAEPRDHPPAEPRNHPPQTYVFRDGECLDLPKLGGASIALWTVMTRRASA